MKPMFIINAAQSSMEEIEIFGQPALFTRHRVKPDTVPNGMCQYEMRSIGNLRHVLVNYADADFSGTVLTLLPIGLGIHGIRLVNQVDINIQGIREYYTPEEFMDKYLSPDGDPERYGKPD